MDYDQTFQRVQVMYRKTINLPKLDSRKPGCKQAQAVCFQNLAFRAAQPLVVAVRIRSDLLC